MPTAAGHLIAGSTTKLWAEFRDWDGAPLSPDHVELVVRDRNLRVLHEPDPADIEQVETGRYVYDYPVPEYEPLIEAEWRGWFAVRPDLVEVVRVRLDVRR
jgi:hypothetical protein